MMGGDTRRIGGRPMMKSVSRGNAGAGTGLADSGEMPGVPGDAAARAPLRERSRDQAGGLRLTGEGSMLGELVRAVLERALESELTAHLGYDRHERGGAGGDARKRHIAKD